MDVRRHLAEPVAMTTAQAAAKAGLSVKGFLAKAGKFRPRGFVETGKRGRPSYDWTAADVARVGK